MEPFESFVTDQMIIECVCRKRTAEAARRHDAHHNHAISSDAKVPEVKHIIYKLTPPRREWIQLGERGRLTKTADGTKQTISTADRTYKSCLSTIERHVRNGVV